tara:strand:- start:1764 stop:2792 length:1029 start_codon:yes stop_codon:yes gene_type:complete
MAKESTNIARSYLVSKILEQLSLDEGSAIKKARMLQRDLSRAIKNNKGVNVRTPRGQVFIDAEAAKALQKQLGNLDVGNRRDMEIYKKRLTDFGSKASRRSRKNVPEKPVVKVGDTDLDVTRDKPSKPEKLVLQDRPKGFRGRQPVQGKVQARGRSTPEKPIAKPDPTPDPRPDPRPDPKPERPSPGSRMAGAGRRGLRRLGDFLNKNLRVAYSGVGGFGPTGNVISNRVGSRQSQIGPDGEYKPANPGLQARGYNRVGSLERKRRAFDRVSPEARKARAATAMQKSGTTNTAAQQRAIKMANSTELVRGARQALAEKCWVGWKKQGMKKKGNRMVPNCVKQ